MLRQRPATSIRSWMLSWWRPQLHHQEPRGYLGWAGGSGLNPKEEVVDEEVELEDNVENMTGSSSGMASQDLFSIPEGSRQSQQSISGVYDAGEESSDVDFRGTHCTLAEHLCQIRKRPRWIKEDMFQEVLQSSEAEKGECREWRETLKEKFKIERQDRKESEERIVKGQKWMIKVIEDQTEKSLIKLQAEHVCSPHLQPIQNCFPCSPNSSHIFFTTSRNVSIPHSLHPFGQLPK
ncbi:uncharacterized protein LOC122458685 [Dermochelys coriacea]|uniref:uncharacterized protein LOC122458685 n=1 Tax=Dermochelys coriacea TaxID=27794 RepID=UPI001CA8116E|nr:uncharacterized protein LOC122458685 [Dermochelys coriacea]